MPWPRSQACCLRPRLGAPGTGAASDHPHPRGASPPEPDPGRRAGGRAPALTSSSSPAPVGGAGAYEEEGAAGVAPSRSLPAPPALLAASRALVRPALSLARPRVAACLIGHASLKLALASWHDTSIRPGIICTGGESGTYSYDTSSDATKTPTYKLGCGSVQVGARVSRITGLSAAWAERQLHARRVPPPAARLVVRAP